MSEENGIVRISIISTYANRKDLTSEKSFKVLTGDYIPAHEVEKGICQPIVDIIRAFEDSGEWPDVTPEETEIKEEISKGKTKNVNNKR